MNGLSTVLTLLALLVATAHGIGAGGYSGFGSLLGYGGGAGPLYPGIVGVPGVGGKSHGHGKQMTLTCAVNFTDHYNPELGIVNAIAVTIKEKRSSYGGIHPSLLPYAAGFGALTGGGHLSATIDIFSVIGGRVSVAFTETARPERGCFAEDFGYFYTGEQHGFRGGAGFGPVRAVGGGYGGALGGAYGGYGQYFGAGGYGGAYGGGLGVAGGLGAFAFPAFGSGGIHGGLGGHGGHEGKGPHGDSVPGVIAEVNVSPGTASEINIDNLSGYSSLKDLAGLGVVVCPSDSVDSDYGSAKCEGGILSCCALHYDTEDQSLSVHRGRY